MNTKVNYDYSISLIRLLASAFIVTCHMMQYLDMELAFWFNVGVQIFLCISGFLYGQKGRIENDLAFYRKTFKRVLIDYYVVMIPALVLFAVFAPGELSVRAMANALLMTETFEAGGHLWYIPYCLLCYLITPFLSRCFEGRRGIDGVKYLLVLGILATVAIECFFNYFNSAWVVCYIIGFFLGVVSVGGDSRLYRGLSLFAIAGAILLNAVQIILDYVIGFEFTGTLGMLYVRYCNYAHVALGTTLFVTLKFLFSALLAKGCPQAIRKLCAYSDKYSYDIYLTHNFFIFGPFSLMQLTEMTGINIVLIVLLILASAFCVNAVSGYIGKKRKTA